MKRLAALALVAVLSLQGCVVSMPASSPSSSDLGPERIETEQATSSRAARLEAGEKWLWASYTALKVRVNPTMDAMKDLYVAAQEMTVAVRACDWIVAMGYFATARTLVSAIASGAGE